MNPIPGEEQFTQWDPDSQPQRASALMGTGFIDEDLFIRLNVGVELHLGKVGIGLQVPLRLRVHDRDPQDNNDYIGVLRREDWDEVSDVFRIIRYVKWGNKGDPFYLRVGQLAARIGHGTIMARYLNNVDVDTYRVGLQFDYNSPYGGLETIVGDVASFADTPESRLMGFRLYGRPWAFVDLESPLNIFHVGFTTISDINAPKTLATSGGQVEIDARGNLGVADTEALTVMGFDVGIDLLDTEYLSVTPYLDNNFILGAGWGMHLGVLTVARLSAGIQLTLPIRAEYRYFQAGYLPVYFSTFYEIERYRFPAGATGGQPKGEVMRLAAGGGRHGYHVDTALNVAGLLQIGALLEGDTSQDPFLALFLNVPALELIQFKAYYARISVDNAGDVFEFDDRSLLVSEARVEVVPFVYLVGRWTRRWVLARDSGDPDRGHYVPADDWNAGVEASFTF